MKILILIIEILVFVCSAVAAVAAMNFGVTPIPIIIMTALSLAGTIGMFTSFKNKDRFMIFTIVGIVLPALIFFSLAIFSR